MSGDAQEVFEEVGGFDEVNTPVNHSDVDLCFRLRERGYTCVYTPHAELTHVGHLSTRLIKPDKENKLPPRKKLILIL